MIQYIKEIAGVVSSVSVLLAVVIKARSWTKKMSDATKCMLRSQILEIYFEHKAERKIPQLGFENVSMLYLAYKGLGGNSFVDKIYSDIKTWEVIE